jgi:hypothetical protein
MSRFYNPVFYNNRNKKSVHIFIENMIDERNEFLKNKYLKLDETIDRDLFLRRIRWLMEVEIIDNHEYEELKNNFLIPRETLKDQNKSFYN